MIVGDDCPACRSPIRSMTSTPVPAAGIPAACIAGFGDGSVHFIKETINPVIWIGLNTIQGGEVLSSDSY